ncbi:hypothetical protein IWX83_003502, partial [Flavobacterium sp. CG_9.1]|nr:hypothetical protein [Flavobacterium sp. CG_9.1]MBG6062061.1 hypothetical protein [Flavobacterium sp. CG_9.1]MBG6062844.1 hypothetical protein [Flavobacterium sp. CG_9.1]MBG6063685.1 hypothetical protein [Flavobacterium sp. CG_9.1]
MRESGIANEDEIFFQNKEKKINSFP